MRCGRTMSHCGSRARVLCSHPCADGAASAPSTGPRRPAHPCPPRSPGSPARSSACFVVGGEHPVGHRVDASSDTRVPCDGVAQTSVEMRCLAADHDTERDDGVVVAEPIPVPPPGFRWRRAREPRSAPGIPASSATLRAPSSNALQILACQVPGHDGQGQLQASMAGSSGIPPEAPLIRAPRGASQRSPDVAWLHRLLSEVPSPTGRGPSGRVLGHQVADVLGVGSHRQRHPPR